MSRTGKANGKEEMRIIYLNCTLYALNKITSEDFQKNTIKAFPTTVILQHLWDMARFYF